MSIKAFKLKLRDLISADYSSLAAVTVLTVLVSGVTSGERT